MKIECKYTITYKKVGIYSVSFGVGVAFEI